LTGPAKAYLFRWPGLGGLLRLAGFYESDDTGRDLLGSMRRGIEQAIEEDSSVLFFPEGTRSRDGEIGEFYRGAFRMAIEYGLPIQPVVIDGIHDILPPGTLLVKTAARPEVRVSYLTPIEVATAADNTRRAARELSNHVRDLMCAELVRLRAERAASESRS
jgi:1-acyl-sn-glycerol-3-phosphate acyltransferase